MAAPSALAPARSTEVAALERPVAPIDLDLLAALPSLPLRARYLVESFLSGRHRNPIKGTAPEFAEYRIYQPGDELRRIDWRLFGRSDRLCVKQFEEESQLRLVLALDLSASLRYSSQPSLLTKFDYARTVLAAVALLARRQCDSVGLAWLGSANAEHSGDSLYDYLRPSSSLAHHHELINRLEHPPTLLTVSLPDALRRLAALLPRGGVVVLASDFYTDLTQFDGVLRLLRSQRIELIGLQVLDPFELDLGSDLTARFVDLEAGDGVALNTAACRTGYRSRFDAFRRDLQECFNGHDAELALQRTDANPLQALSAYLARRARVA